MEVLNLADKYSLRKVKEEAFKYVEARFVYLPEDQIQLLSFEQIRGFIASDGLLSCSEWDIFCKVIANACCCFFV